MPRRRGGHAARHDGRLPAQGPHLFDIRHLQLPHQYRLLPALYLHRGECCVLSLETELVQFLHYQLFPKDQYVDANYHAHASAGTYLVSVICINNNIEVNIAALRDQKFLLNVFGLHCER